MDTMLVMSKFGINELNKSQLKYIDRYNKKQDKLMHLAIYLTLLVLIIDKIIPSVALPQIVLCIVVSSILVSKIWMYLFFKKNLLSLSTPSSVINSRESLEGLNKSYFKVTRAEKVYCHACNSEMYRLSDERGQGSPEFYICFDCKYIGHIGVGQVEVKEN